MRHIGFGFVARHVTMSVFSYDISNNLSLARKKKMYTQKQQSHKSPVNDHVQTAIVAPTPCFPFTIFESHIIKVAFFQASYKSVIQF